MKILIEALRDYGTREIAGSPASPDILAMARDAGATSYVSDETAWCGLAMAAWVKRAGGMPPAGFLAARSWLRWGVEAKEPTLGDVVVFWRVAPNSWQGHVAIFVTARNGLIYALGGNQSNMVNITGYKTSELLGYRRVAGLT